MSPFTGRKAGVPFFLRFKSFFGLKVDVLLSTGYNVRNKNCTGDDAECPCRVTAAREGSPQAEKLPRQGRKEQRLLSRG